MANLFTFRNLSPLLRSRSILGTLQNSSLLRLSPAIYNSKSVLKLPDYSSSPLLCNNQVAKFSLSQKDSCRDLSYKDHDHVRHWTAEKMLTVFMLGSLPVILTSPTPGFEYILALALSVHSHWGIEALVVDYVRPSMFGKTIPKIATGAVYLLSIATFGALCYFIYSDVGIVNAVKLLWQL